MRCYALCPFGMEKSMALSQVSFHLMCSTGYKGKQVWCCFAFHRWRQRIWEGSEFLACVWHILLSPIRLLRRQCWFSRNSTSPPMLTKTSKEESSTFKQNTSLYLSGCTGSQLQHTGALVAARELVSCGMWNLAPRPGIKPRPLH